MRFPSILFCSLLSAARLSAVQIGNTLEQVMAEKGKPTSEMTVGTTKVLNYEDQSIKLKEGKVVEVNEAVRSAAPAPAVGSASSTAAVTPSPVKRENPPIKAGTWTVNVKAAIAQGKKEHKRIFLLFTGSDWSAVSQRFYKEVLSTPEFGRYAIDNLILVMLDFPKTIAQNESVKAQNEALLKAFAIQRYPTVVLLGTDGKTLGMIPFEEGGPAKFLDSLKKL